MGVVGDGHFLFIFIFLEVFLSTCTSTAVCTIGQWCGRIWLLLVTVWHMAV